METDMSDEFTAVTGDMVCLRWHRYRNPVTAEQIIAAREESVEAYMEIKARLTATTAWVLQMSHDGKEWLDVPYVEEPHPTNI